jgi:hypothetical protein
MHVGARGQHCCIVPSVLLEDIATIFIFRVIFDGGTTSARAVREGVMALGCNLDRLMYETPHTQDKQSGCSSSPVLVRHS